MVLTNPLYVDIRDRSNWIAEQTYNRDLVTDKCVCDDFMLSDKISIWEFHTNVANTNKQRDLGNLVDSFEALLQHFKIGLQKTSENHRRVVKGE